LSENANLLRNKGAFLEKRDQYHDAFWKI